VNASPEPRGPSRVIRFLGILLGALSLIVGILMVVRGHVEGFRGILGAISLIVMGVLFARFGLTGRSRLWRSRSAQ
jgi:hypothetical protein